LSAISGVIAPETAVKSAGVGVAVAVGVKSAGVGVIVAVGVKSAGAAVRVTAAVGVTTVVRAASDER
jgi:hypothetical protein